jgi:hypothetical protein
MRLCEVKSKGWHFGDLFKVRGWMHYLKLENVALIAKASRENLDRLEQVAEAIGIIPVIIDGLGNCEVAISKMIKQDGFDSVDVITWRYSYWLERVMLRKLIHKKKCQEEQKRFKVLDDYYFKVNSSLFFVVSTVDRIDELYSTYKIYPHVSAKCSHEMNDESFDDEYEELPSDIYRKTFYYCEDNDIQISTFIEHRARLAIFKNGIDYLLYKVAGDSKRARDSLTLRSGDRVFKISKLSMLPSSFCSGLEKISKHKYFYCYPIFWQWFLWLFGGFILKDKEAEEYKILSSKTGIPVEEIPNAFESYELLFPRNGGWFIDLPSDSNIRMMHMFPVPFMGIGANYRRLIYTENCKFGELDLSGQYTLSDLLKWNNLVVDVLKD